MNTKTAYIRQIYCSLWLILWLCFSSLVWSAESSSPSPASPISIPWRTLTNLMTQRGILRDDLPAAQMASYDKTWIATQSGQAESVTGAIAELTNYVQTVKIDLTFVTTKRNRLQGQVIMGIQTRGGTQNDQDRLYNTLDAANTLLDAENYTAANILLNELQAMIDLFRSRPMAPMPKYCTDPIPPSECKYWLPKPATPPAEE